MGSTQVEPTVIYQGEACTLVRTADGDLEFRLEDEQDVLDWRWLAQQVAAAQDSLDEDSACRHRAARAALEKPNEKI